MEIKDSKGVIANGGTTFERAVIVNGTAAANEDVEVYDGAAIAGIAPVNPGGNWSYELASLAIGTHSITAKAQYGNGQVSALRSFKCESLPLTLDTSPLILSGKIYINAGGGMPSPLPSGSFIQRQASGGTPPYTYTSSNNTVASVNDSGLVQSQSNGSASITVNDSENQTLSYTVTVSGAFRFIYAGSGQWYPPSNAGNILSRALMADIWNQCANNGGVAALGIPGGIYWTGTTSDNIRRYYTRNLSNGAEGAEAGQGIGSASHYILKRAP